MKIAFFGTPEFSVPFLTALDNDEDLIVSTVICQPDKPVGRKKVLTAPATKQYALEHNIKVLQPASLKKDPIELDADLFIVVAYGKIIPQNILDIPKHGTVNVHPSLLPKYRGPSPMQAAIANLDRETGVSIMLLDAKMDHGPLLAQETIKLDGTETYPDLQHKVHALAPGLLVDTVKAHTSGSITPKEQDHDAATICKLLSRDDGKVDWNDSAEVIDAKRRAYTPWPGVSMTWDEKTFKIHNTSISDKKLPVGGHLTEENRLFFGTSTTALEILEIQPEGKQRMKTEDFLRGK
ncbi:methionyl-tRNA formyltransferase [Candidatus Uhrbacteria bacterium]|jgi:methionyl-tRNA formyltransferase|nr:methionyl-tRNA formyltransferase [Candidatus Uhrbacteria bacterium]